MQLEGHRALPQQIEFIGRFAFAKQIGPGHETQVARTAGERGTEFGAEAGEERLLEDYAFKSLHRHPFAIAPSGPRGRSDRRSFLGDIDPDRAPGNATPTADAT